MRGGAQIIQMFPAATPTESVLTLRFDDPKLPIAACLLMKLGSEQKLLRTLESMKLGGSEREEKTFAVQSHT